MIHDVAHQAMDLGFDYSGDAVTYETLELRTSHAEEYVGDS